MKTNNVVCIHPKKDRAIGFQFLGTLIKTEICRQCGATLHKK